MISQKSSELEYWKDKRVLITGGTKGLGKALVNILVKELAARVVIVARGHEGLEELRNIHEDNFYTIQADIGDKEAIHKISGQTIAMLEGIDILINNASSLGPVPLKPLIDTQCEELEETLQVNLLGPFRLIRVLLPYMKLNQNGVIINISSDAAVQPYPTWGSYSISKAALDHMTAIWQEELRDDTVEMISLDPGDMYTDLHLAAIPDANPDDLYKPEEVARDLIRFISLQKFNQTRFSASQWREVL